MNKAAVNRGSLGSATLWMVGLSVLLFWIPTVGPLIAGFVGGRKAGDVGPAIVAAIIPAVFVSVLLFLLGTLVSLPVIGALVGAGMFFVVVFEGVPLLIGAIIGGALAE
jgi:predicted branched-subunit amino acid permease